MFDKVGGLCRYDLLIFVTQGLLIEVVLVGGGWCAGLCNVKM